jgi:O-antigen/teichoic acid export membrane protein
VTFTVLLLMGTVHTALLTEPMLVIGPGRYPRRTAAYLRRLTALHAVLTVGMGGALLLAVAVLAWLSPAFGGVTTLVALAAAAPAILWLWLARRACYIDSRPSLAAAGGLGYAVLVPAALLTFAWLGLLTSAAAVLVLGAASLPVAWWLTRQLERSGAGPRDPVDAAEVRRAHWGYGRWALGTGLLSWVPANAVVLALPLWHSLDDAATLRVATTLALPVLHVQGALAPLLIPALVRARRSGGLRSTTSLAAALFIGLAVLYVPVLLVLGSRLVELLFGPRYQLDAAMLLMLAALPLVAAVSGVAAAVLRAMERPDQVLWTYVAATAITCVAGLPLVYAYSAHGALASLVLSSAVTAALGTAACRRVLRHGAGVSGPEPEAPPAAAVASQPARWAAPRPGVGPRHRAAS